MINKSTKYWLLSTILFLSAVSCKKERPTDYPYVAVNLSLNLNNPAYINLQNIGGWVYVQGGIQGILLYRKDEGTVNAFDRVSTYQIENECRIIVASDNIHALDTCSNSKFLLSDGYPAGGPATQPLIQYQSVLTGSTLTVSN